MELGWSNSVGVGTRLRSGRLVFSF